jgi:ferrous iron transport protein A
VFMAEDQPESSCRLLSDIQALCRRQRQCGKRMAQSATPLSESRCNSRMRVCAVNGDRKTCARMANLGVLPGSELELLCKGGGQQCMIKVNGGTISLDAPTAAAILVAPA